MVQTLRYILILIVLVIGAFFPLAWVLIYLLVKQDSSTRARAYEQSLEPSKPSYMKSKEWDTLRRSILHRDNYTCQKCNIKNVPLDVHHITYIRFTKEKTENLISICRSCHTRLHNELGYNRTNTFPIN